MKTYLKWHQALATLSQTLISRLFLWWYGESGECINAMLHMSLRGRCALPEPCIPTFILNNSAICVPYQQEIGLLCRKVEGSRWIGAQPIWLSCSRSASLFCHMYVSYPQHNVPQPQSIPNFNHTVATIRRHGRARQSKFISKAPFRGTKQFEWFYGGMEIN